MIPELSSVVIESDILEPHDIEKEPLVDIVRGGKDLLDSSEGLNIKNWQIYKEEDKIYIKAEDGEPVEIDVVPNTVSWLSMCFDQNMHYHIAYINEGITYWYWYDPVAEKYQSLELGSDIITPIARFDDARMEALSESDIILSYIRNGKLCCRVERQRYEIEHILQDNVSGNIVRCGMNRKFRFQWEVL